MQSKFAQIAQTLRARAVLVAVLVGAVLAAAVGGLGIIGTKPLRVASGVIGQKPVRVASGVIGTKQVRAAQEMPPIPRTRRAA